MLNTYAPWVPANNTLPLSKQSRLFFNFDADYFPKITMLDSMESEQMSVLLSIFMDRYVTGTTDEVYNRRRATVLVDR
ncbi:hypothetical protein KP79_PYT20880 [Mizuhopecten yessoensis]|uniref:Uncharacterized protein n=1 Tax=Mizuhopecten yessoensis TaxID=6573 RepID=A0A210PZF1_MIZYE|nr:hypothetical protein KP79_PYT20880 [Mizuhopecten yessoensis]